MSVTESHGVILDAANQLSYGTVKLRAVGDDDVLIKIHSAPINPSDVLFTQGHYPAEKKRPTIAGFEGSGLVIQTGSSEKAKALLNQRVTFFSFGSETLGTYGTHTVVEAATVFPIPGDLTYEEAAFSLVNPLTVEGFIQTCLRENHKVIVHTAAASSLGRMLVVSCKQNNITLINIVRREEQVKILKDLGAENILNSSDPAYPETLAKTFETLKPTALFDAIGGPDGSALLSAMPNGSTTFNYGVLSLQPYSISATDLIFKNKTLRGYWLTNDILNPEVAPLIFKSAFTNLATRSFTVTVAKTFGQDEYKEAFEYYSKNSTEGKVLLQNRQF